MGMKGAGKTTAVRYLAAKGLPKVTNEVDALVEIRNLFAAGKREIVLDGVESWKDYIDLKREFPGQMKTIAIVAPRVVRWRRLAKDTTKDLTRLEVRECDRIEIEEMGIGEMVVAADAYVYNNGEVGDLQKRLEIAMEEARK